MILSHFNQSTFLYKLQSTQCCSFRKKNIYILIAKRLGLETDF